MNTITAIETFYGGCNFRSRLEARWAVFFDTLGIKWEYEKEGYTFVEGENVYKYLPDFWLPELKQWLEIKGQTPTIEECHLCERLATLGHPASIVWGNILDHTGYFWLPDGTHGPTNWFKCECYLTGLAEVKADVCECAGELTPDYNDRYIRAAYIAARSARFEFNPQEPGPHFRHKDDL